MEIEFQATPNRMLEGGQRAGIFYLRTPFRPKQAENLYWERKIPWRGAVSLRFFAELNQGGDVQDNP